MGRRTSAVGDENLDEIGPLARGLQQRQGSLALNTNYSYDIPALSSCISAPAPGSRQQLAGSGWDWGPQSSRHNPPDSFTQHRSPLTGISLATASGGSNKSTAASPLATAPLSWQSVCEAGRAEADRKRGLCLPIDDSPQLKQWLRSDLLARQGLSPAALSPRPQPLQPHYSPAQQQPQLQHAAQHPNPHHNHHYHHHHDSGSAQGAAAARCSAGGGSGTDGVASSISTQGSGCGGGGGPEHCWRAAAQPHPQLVQPALPAWCMGATRGGGSGGTAAAAGEAYGEGPAAAAASGCRTTTAPPPPFSRTAPRYPLPYEALGQVPPPVAEVAAAAGFMWPYADPASAAGGGGPRACPAWLR